MNTTHKLTRALFESAPELFREPPEEGEYTRIQRVKYVFNKTEYVFNKAGNAAVPYIVETEDGTHINGLPHMQMSEDAIKKRLEKKTLCELLHPVFIYEGTPIFRANKKTFYVQREAERTYVSRRSNLPQRRTWYDILKIKE